MYIHQELEWPNFIVSSELSPLLAEVRHLQGRLLGKMEALGFELREEATLQILTQDVLKTSEIEGEKLDLEQVRSSLAKRLGLDKGPSPYVDRNVDGIVDVMLDATRNYNIKLTKDRLFDWHAALFPTGRSGMHRIKVANWRDASSEDMQVVSGPYGREKVHYEAPSYDRLESEMKKFLDWFNADSEMDPVIKSAIAHFWFVTIHPFDDGNGRIGRAIADMMLARSEKSSQRFYSMSSQILHERNDYYNILELCQKGTLDITPWIEWCLECLKRAIKSSDNMLRAVLVKAEFWQTHASELFNDRQHTMINRLLDGFEGKLTSSKWAKITKCSQDTAGRDIKDLLGRKILFKNGAGGRSTGYELYDYSFTIDNLAPDDIFELNNKVARTLMKEFPNNWDSGYKKFRHDERFKILREAWCVARLCELESFKSPTISAGKKNSNGDDVDIVLQANNQIYSVQVVEAVEEMNLTNTKREGLYTWGHEESLILKSLEKKAKKYKKPEDLNLLIYANPKDGAFRETDSDISRIKNTAKELGFRQIWLLMSGDFNDADESHEIRNVVHNLK
jgi:Fic family protein